MTESMEKLTTGQIARLHARIHQLRVEIRWHNRKAQEFKKELVELEQQYESEFKP